MPFYVATNSISEKQIYDKNTTLLCMMMTEASGHYRYNWKERKKNTMFPYVTGLEFVEIP